MPEAPLISVHALSKHYRSFKRREGILGGLRNLFHREYQTVKAVENINFEIGRGEMVGYIGPNGAGKSTTIKMLTGILVPTSGEISSNGFVPWRQRAAHATLVGHRRHRIFQAPPPHLRRLAARFRRAHGTLQSSPWPKRAAPRSRPQTLARPTHALRPCRRAPAQSANPFSG